MRKALFAAFALLTVCVVMARPASRQPVTITQPDGLPMTLLLHGDEHFHYNTTADGYTVVQAADGSYVYVDETADGVVPSTVVAHDAAVRQAAETQWLSTRAKGIIDREEHRRALARAPRRIQGPNFDYDDFHGLVVLVNFSDKKFGMSDPNEFYSTMINEHDFTGYTDTAGRWVDCTGSMRDYFYENSSGIFDPVFDIFGPVDVNYKATDMAGGDNATTIFQAALRALNDEIDYSRYDTNNDGTIDMIYFIVAGYASSFSGNNGSYLWPHASSFWGWTRYDGKYLGRYACSTELYGWTSTPSTITTEGIGTMCHEFSHVLGLPDFYDTDYAKSGGESNHPNDWDLMAGGGDFNYGRTPVGYSLYERYAMGWAQPIDVTAAGDFTLEPVNVGNSGLILRSPVDKEFFVVENRQRTRWDAYLPGHGMLVTRVDSTNVSVWDDNIVNANPDRNYFELVRAAGPAGTSAQTAFPGSNSVMMVTNTTPGNLLTWSGKDNAFNLINIREENNLVTLSVVEDRDYTALIEDFENMESTTETALKGVEGNFTNWDFVKCNVVTPIDEDYCASGTQAVAMLNPSAFYTAAGVGRDIYMATVSINNTSSTDAKFSFETSKVGGVSWSKQRNAAGATSVTVKAGTRLVTSWPLSVAATDELRFRLSMTAGNKSVPCYIDDVMLFYTPSAFKRGDVNGDGIIDVQDVSDLLDVVLGNRSADTLIGDCHVAGNEGIDVTDVSLLIDLVLGNSTGE